jgi:hypothetical protein
MNTTRELTRIRRLAAHLAGRLGCLQDPVSSAPALPRAGTAPTRGTRSCRLFRAGYGLAAGGRRLLAQRAARARAAFSARLGEWS